MTVQADQYGRMSKATRKLLTLGVVLTLAGCVVPAHRSGHEHTGARATPTVRYETCASPRTLQRDLSLNGVYQGVEQLYIRWDGTPCKLATETR